MNLNVEITRLKNLVPCNPSEDDASDLTGLDNNELFYQLNKVFTFIIDANLKSRWLRGEGSELVNVIDVNKLYLNQVAHSVYLSFVNTDIYKQYPNIDIFQKDYKF